MELDRILVKLEENNKNVEEKINHQNKELQDKEE